jgi:Transglutaminase-like superfamily
VPDVQAYAAPGPLTSLEGFAHDVLVPFGDPVSICSPVHALVLQPREASALGLRPQRLAENQLRPVAKIVAALLALNPEPLNRERAPAHRVVGTCRHFALLSCALLRYHGIPARARCGFATYFQAGQGLDHWVTEYWDASSTRWVRVDSEVMGGTVLDHPDNLRTGEFLSGGEAWTAYRQGTIDASRFGVYGTGNWGPGEIRGNLVKDLAALNKVEMLPWDVWGRMEDAYHDRAGPAYDQLLDELAAACAADDPVALARLYGHPDLRAPADLVG